MQTNTQVPMTAVSSLQWPAFLRPEQAFVQSLLFQMEHSQWWSPDELLRQQLRQVALVVQHAARTVPFHETRLAQFANIPPNDFTLGRLREIPILTRADVQEHSDALRTREVPANHGKTFEISTSGSTGRPIRVLGTSITSTIFRTLGIRYHLWHRREFDQPNMSIRLVSGDRPKKRVLNGWAPGFSRGTAIAYCATLPLPELYEGLSEHEPVYLQSYPSVLRGLIEQSIADGSKPARLREVRTFGGVVEPELRDLCDHAWGVPIVDNYSAMEIGIIALQCPDTLNLHVQSESVLVEVLRDDDSPCESGEVGRVIVTVLHNFATPLIRYELGDYAEVGEPCSCGRGLPTLKRIVGRQMHLFTLPDGRRVVPYVASGEFRALGPIRQFQIIQKTLEDVEVVFAASRTVTDNEEAALLAHLRKHLHADFDYRFRYVDEIPRGKTGKFEMLRSELS